MRYPGRATRSLPTVGPVLGHDSWHWPRPFVAPTDQRENGRVLRSEKGLLADREGGSREGLGHGPGREGSLASLESRAMPREPHARCDPACGPSGGTPIFRSSSQRASAFGICEHPQMAMRADLGQRIAFKRGLASFSDGAICEERWAGNSEGAIQGISLGLPGRRSAAPEIPCRHCRAGNAA
jgi:hypothetical protein